jgi:hypothetical protein
MVISAVATAESFYEVTGEGYAPRGEILKDGKPAAKNPVLENDGASLRALQRIL